MMAARHLILASATALSLACAGVEDAPEASEAAPELATSKSALKEQNGGNLNGGNLNGGNLNGGNLNGGNLNGTDLSQHLVSVDYAGAMLNGTMPLDSVQLVGTTFVGQKGTTTYTGNDFLQAQFNGNLGDGTQVRLRVKYMQPGPVGNSDLTQYWVEFRGSDNNWHPACRDHTGAPQWALPVQGRWDYRVGEPGGGSKISDPARFTFACMGGAIAKCVLFGYRPWATHGSVALENHHQACTRLIRADYCGDGASHTINGNWVNLYDALGIQQDTENWFFEAEWDEDGARCFYPLNRSRAGIPCYDDRVELLCGQDLSPSRGVLLWNETPQDMITKTQ